MEKKVWVQSLLKYYFGLFFPFYATSEILYFSIQHICLTTLTHSSSSEIIIIT